MLLTRSSCFLYSFFFPAVLYLHLFNILFQHSFVKDNDKTFKILAEKLGAKNKPLTDEGLADIKKIREDLCSLIFDKESEMQAFIAKGGYAKTVQGIVPILQVNFSFIVHHYVHCRCDLL